MALRLFERRGFDEVTMDEVARVAGVSRRTLFRLFPSKADLVWEGLDEVLMGVRAQATQLPRGASLDAVVDALFAESLRVLDHPAVARIARRRLRLIAASPALLTHGTLDRLEAVVAAVVEAARGKRAPPATLVARTLFAVGFAALLWWAQSEGAMAPLEVLKAALSALAEASPPRRAGRGPRPRAGRGPRPRAGRR